LKQAQKVWNRKIDNVFLHFGFKKCQADHNIHKLKISTWCFLGFVCGWPIYFQQGNKINGDNEKMLVSRIWNERSNWTHIFIQNPSNENHNKVTINFG
jgi:hypothetical protein